MRTSIVILAVAALFLAALMVATPVAICVMAIALLAPVVVRPVAREAVRCDDQPVSLLSLVSFRAPPRGLLA